MNRTVLLLITLLLPAFLVGGQVAWAADASCQGWGKATFVYAADTVETCLDADLDVNAGINRTGTTPLIGAAQLGDSDAVWLLLAAGANPNKQDRKGWTPLMFAAQAGHQDIVRQLAKADADPHLRNDAGQTALLLALEQEQIAMVGPLAAAGATINAATLVWLVEQGQQSAISALAAAGVNLDIRLAGGATLLMRAAELGQQTMVEQLIAGGLDPNRQAQNGETALLRAAEAGHRDIAAYLLRFQTDNGARSLAWAGAQGRSGAVEQLLALGVDPNTNAYSKSWKRPCPQLYVAADAGHTSFVTQLLAAGADPNCWCGDTPALWVALGRPAMFEQFIGAGADVNIQDEYGRTALMVSVYGDENDRLPVMERLIAANADLNIQDASSEGRYTALMIAAAVDHCDMVARLVEAGADVTIRNGKGRTALDIARASRKGWW